LEVCIVCIVGSSMAVAPYILIDKQWDSCGKPFVKPFM
jgi:hypothetical protein